MTGIILPRMVPERFLGDESQKKKLDLNKFKKAMKGIYIICISKKTIDEAPMAYKPVDMILPYLKHVKKNMSKKLINFI